MSPKSKKGNRKSNPEEIISAATNGDLRRVVRFIERGGNVNARNKHGSTALHVASLNGNLELVRYLVSQGASLHIRNSDKETPLLLACGTRRWKVVRFLVEMGSRVNAQNSSGTTPFHFACEHGPLVVVEFLLKQGAKSNVKDKYGLSPVEAAQRNPQKRVLKFLQKRDKGSSELDDQANASIATSRQAMKKALQLQKATTDVNGCALHPVELSKDYVQLCTGRFSPSQKIGSGAYGDVYLGKDQVLKMEFVVKRALFSFQDKGIVQEVERSFKKEIAALAKFRHPNIITMYGYCLGGQDSPQFLVYERASKGSLDRYLQSDWGRLQLNAHRRCTIIFQLVRSVNFLHSGGYGGGLKVFHRDIKSANLCLMEDFTAKLIDCGVAKLLSEKESRDPDSSRSSASTLLNSSGRGVVGTPGYIDPHYSRLGGAFTSSMDVYSIGVVMVELIVGCLQMQRLGDFYTRYVKDQNDEPIKDGPKTLAKDADELIDWELMPVEKLSELAVKCMDPNESRRISIEGLVEQLDQLSTCKDLFNQEKPQRTLIKREVSSNKIACVLCHRAICGATCSLGHLTCSSCLEDIAMTQMGQGDNIHCALEGCCSSAYGDNVLYGALSYNLYTIYKRERVKQQKIDNCLATLESNQNKILEKLEGVTDDMKRSLSALAMLSAENKIPYLLWITPSHVEESAKDPRKWVPKLTKARYNVCFICQCCYQPGHEPFEISVPRAWLARLVQVLKIGLVVLKTVGMVYGLPFPSPDVPWPEKLRKITEFYDSIAEDAELLDNGDQPDYNQFNNANEHPTNELNGPALSLLVEKANKLKNTGWKSEMKAVLNGEGQIIWVHRKGCEPNRSKAPIVVAQIDRAQRPALSCSCPWGREQHA